MDFRKHGRLMGAERGRLQTFLDGSLWIIRGMASVRMLSDFLVTRDQPVDQLHRRYADVHQPNRLLTL